MRVRVIDYDHSLRMSFLRYRKRMIVWLALCLLAMLLYVVSSAVVVSAASGALGSKRFDIALVPGEIRLTAQPALGTERWSFDVMGVENSGYFSRTSLVLGFGAIRSGGVQEWYVPLWPWPWLCLAGAVLTFARGRPGDTPHCPRCDYDLTGNVSGVCPECGESIAASLQ
jgi:hypothetical protein